MPSKGCGVRKTIILGKYHIDAVDGLKTRMRKSEQHHRGRNEKAKFYSLCSIGFAVPV